MKHVLWCALLLVVCSAAPPSQVRIDCGAWQAHGTRIGHGLVLTCSHTFQHSKKKAAPIIDERHAFIVASGGRKLRDDTPADDGCDWELLRVNAYSDDPEVPLARAAVGDRLWFWGYNKRKNITVVEVGDEVASFLGDGPVPGESGTSVWNSDGELVGIITSYSTPCSGGHCPVDHVDGWFCMVGPEIEAAVDKARGE